MQDVVELDGIGGTIILVHGMLVRDGVGFPAFPFNHSVETARSPPYHAPLVPHLFVVHGAHSCHGTAIRHATHEILVVWQEGFGKMATEMGYRAYGMPMVKVWHK